MREREESKERAMHQSVGSGCGTRNSMNKRKPRRKLICGKSNELAMARWLDFRVCQDGSLSLV
jgi:hypothetical protein